ncbi:MAG: hypothetical protein AB7O62_11145 [Pirellulales bacterium]
MDMPVVAESRRKLGVGKILFVFGVVLLIAAVIGLALWRAGMEARLDREVARIHEAGDPITAEEMAAFYRLPEGADDCTRLYVEACQGLKGPAFDQAAAKLPYVNLEIEESSIPFPPEPWPELEAAEKFLASYQSWLDLLHEAARRGGAARYVLDFSKGINVSVDHATALRQSGRLLQLQALVQAHRDNAPGAAAAILAQWRAAESLAQEPLLVSQLIRIALGRMAMAQLETLRGTTEFSDDDLRMLQRAFRQYDGADALYRSLRGERWFAYDAIMHPVANNFLDDPKFLDKFFRHQDTAFVLEHMARLIAAAKGTMPTMRQEFADLDAGIQTAAEPGWLDKLHTNHASDYGILSTAPVDVLFRAQARAMAADAAIAAELYRRQHDALPATLEALVPDFLPAVPVDPFSGLPLLMSARADELVIYSIGPDGIDDGGVVRVEIGMTPDEGFSLRPGPK